MFYSKEYKGGVQMKSKILASVLLIIMMISVIKTSFAYSDDLFKFDLPDNYYKTTYEGYDVFIDKNNSNRAMLIAKEKNTQIKKNIWDIEDDDLDRLTRLIGYGANAQLVEKNKKAKLGKEKAIEMIYTRQGAYVDVYFLASNKYIYMVGFTGSSMEELKNEDFLKIQKSFKLKDRTTNFKALYYVLIALAVIIGTVIKNRKRLFPQTDNYDAKVEPIKEIKSNNDIFYNKD